MRTQQNYGNRVWRYAVSSGIRLTRAVSRSRLRTGNRAWAVRPDRWEAIAADLERVQERLREIQRSLQPLAEQLGHHAARVEYALHATGWPYA